MSIINVTPDSFYAASRTFDSAAVQVRIRSCVEAGADILDIGGYSSRPGAAEVSPDEELRRVAVGVRIAREVAPDMAVSIDTFRASVVKGIVAEFGKVIVNDISAGELDSRMAETVAMNSLPYIAMHMRGTPQTMQLLTEYDDTASQVAAYLNERAEVLRQAGIENIILDPGFGFAKTTEQNYQLLAGLEKICNLGYPTLVGISRKSMIYKVLDSTPEASLDGTDALHWRTLEAGAKILRVHDTRAAADIIKLYNYYNRYGKTDSSSD